MKNIFFVFGLIYFFVRLCLCRPQVTVLANSIDLELSRGYLDNLTASGVTVDTIISLRVFRSHKSDLTSSSSEATMPLKESEK